MINCEKVSRLLSESMDRRLSFWERVGLWFHLSMCKLCGGFSKDLQRLREAVRRHAEEIDSDTGASDATLSVESRQRMKRLLESQES